MGVTLLCMLDRSYPKHTLVMVGLCTFCSSVESLVAGSRFKFGVYSSAMMLRRLQEQRYDV
jgi:hypothetical protein